MRLSEALVLRADTQKRIEQLRGRLRDNVLVQEGERPAEDPRALLDELDRLLGQLTDLVGRINRTNLTARLADGTTLTDALARRDTLRLHESILGTVADAATNKVSRYSRSEIRNVPSVDIGAIRCQSDDLARQHRELDTAIQAANWTTDLLD